MTIENIIQNFAYVEHKKVKEKKINQIITY